MFKGKNFYHSHVRKAVAAFGTIFNNIIIERKDSSGSVAQTLRVPLAYSTKQKFISRIEQVPTVESRGEVAIVLPRMGFEIISLQYDAARRVSPIHHHKKGSGSATSVKSVFTSTPYDLSLQLYVFAKNQDDGLQIIEQILPFFNPDFSITVNDLPELGIKRDIKLTLDSVAYEDQSQGTFADRASIVWTLTFNMKLNLYGHVGDQNVIKKAVANIFQNPDLAGARTTQQYTVVAATTTGVATLLSQSVDTISLTYAGGNYGENGPNVTISGGGGSGARASVVMEVDPINTGKYRVKNVVINDGGSGYTSVPTVTFEAPDSGNQSVDDAYRFLEEFDETYE
jgi:hypothetical protein